MLSPSASADLHPLLALIARHVRATPDVPALICEGETLSYGALWVGAERVAANLTADGLQPGDRVAFDAARVPEGFVNLLGILIAGGIYVPLSEKAPPARHAIIIADSGARFRLDGAQCARLEGAASGDAEPPGYILYTSGSTGVPKGVQVGLDSVQAYMTSLHHFYPLEVGERAAQMADLGFDLSVQEIFHPWASGATLCAVPTRNILMWPRYFRDLEIGAAALVPSVVRLADEQRLLRDGSLPALRFVALGAELVTGHIVRRMRATAPNARLVNFWGPTEATVYLTHYPIERDIPDHEGVPIGLPWPGQTLSVDGGEETGELLIAGSQLCRGYWRMPEANADRFVERGGVRFYRTGDIGRFDPALNSFVFVARADRQVKVKGHRIELDECERAVRKGAGTDRAYVLVDGDALVCFLPEGIDTAPIDEALRAELPNYMIPARYIAVADFPLTASNKVDLKALRPLIPQG